ncbi:MAG: 1-phosphofructokinase family hexose kinase [Anaerolineae bacterium]|nr:1-phosphofructokinase family hexose kinase [Anaerolineae bacterium]
MIYTLTLNPTLDRTLTVEGFAVGGTYKTSHDQCLPAGKGINAARVVATLGAPVTALGLVGGQDAAVFADALRSAGIEDRLIAIPGRTRNSVTILDPVAGTETHVREQGSTPPASAMERVRHLVAGLTPGDWLILAGSLPPGLGPDTYRDLCRRCAARGVRTVLDANGPPLLAGAEAPPTVLKPNLFELWQLDRRCAEGRTEIEPDVADLDAVLAAARRVQELGIEVVVVTLGARGAIGIDRGGQAWHAVVALDRPLVDAVGSGDALGAGLTKALSEGAPLAEALRLGVACGAANALVAGAGRCQLGDIERLAGRAAVSQVAERRAGR